MDPSLLRTARSVLLPVAGEAGLDDHDRGFLRGGGRALLVGETRAEYVARAMSHERRDRETLAWFTQLTADAQRAAGAPVLIAIDQELGGICRMHGLVSELPSADEAHRLDASDIQARTRHMSDDLVALGVNLALPA